MNPEPTPPNPQPAVPGDKPKPPPTVAKTTHPAATTPPGPRVVIPTHTLRGSLIAIACGLVVLGFVIYGVVHMGSPVQGNKLTGTIVEKSFEPFKEQRIEFSGRKLEGVKDSDGDYWVKVRVEALNKTYDIRVDPKLYDSKKVGDSLEFIRPPKEQKLGTRED